MATAPALALKEDANQPIHIEGDNAEIDQESQTITYTGSVEIVQGSLHVWGDKMVIKVDGDQVEQITTSGAPARYQQQLDNEQGEVQARASSIVYHTRAERVYLNGDAWLRQKGNTLTGESIRYNIVDGVVDASAGSDTGRVRMQLEPSLMKSDP